MWLLLASCYDNTLFYIAMTKNLHIYLQCWEHCYRCYKPHVYTAMHGFMRNLQLSVPCQMLMGVLEIRESKGMQTFSTI